MREKKDLTSNCVVLINHHPIKRALNDMEGLFLLFFFYGGDYHHTGG
jgi:hypothetical protein